jgi:phage/plasmid-associated DNA primase
MTNFITTERVALDKCFYLMEMKYEDFRQHCSRCDNEDERKKMYNKMKDLCMKFIVNNGSISREYKYSDSMVNCGRLSSCGMQGVMREFRGFLMSDYTTDIDQDNSHPVILSWLCHKHNIDCEALDDYINNRDRVLKTFLPLTRAEAKACLLKSINKDMHDKNNKNLFYKVWDKEMKQIQMELLQIPEYKTVFDTVPADKEYNRNGSKMSRILCFHENLILQVALHTMNENGIEVSTLMADGCMIYGNHYGNDELLDKIKNACDTAFVGLHMNWSYKPHSTDIVIPEGWKSKSVLKGLKEEAKLEKKELKQSEPFEEFFPYDVATDVGVVKLIIALYPNKFIWIKDKTEATGLMYSWTGTRWEKGNLEFIRFISGELVEKLHDFGKRAIDKFLISNPKLLDTIKGALLDAERNFKTRSQQIKYIETSQAFLINEIVKFDDNPDIIGFNNGVYDLIKHEFRPVEYSDYITMTCGYDYNANIDPAKLKEMEDLLQTIIPDKQSRELLLEILSAGLTGHCIEKFVLFNGAGRNGKGLIDEFAGMLYGDYALIYANVSLLTEKDKTGCNPEKASVHNKRIVIMKEPDANEKLYNSCIKSLTGGGNISGRMLYSNNTTVILRMILIMECNERPEFKNEPGNAEEDRVVDLLFPNRFTTMLDEIDNHTVFLGNPEFKTKAWKESHRDAFLHILIQSFKKLQANKYSLTIPVVVANRTSEYLNQSIPIVGLFNETYMKTGNPKDILKLKYVYNNIKTSIEFMNLSRELKRKYNYNYFCDFMQKNAQFRADYRNRNNNGVLCGYKLKTFEEDIVEVEISESFEHCDLVEV